MIDKYKLVEEIRKNVKGREMSFEFETKRLTNAMTVFTVTVSLNPNWTYEDVAEELVSQFKRLVADTCQTYFESPKLYFSSLLNYTDIQVYNDKAVTWFIPCEFEQEPTKENFKRHMADWLPLNI